MVRDELMEALRTSPEVRATAERVEAQLADESLSALEGAQEILRTFAGSVATLPWASDQG